MIVIKVKKKQSIITNWIGCRQSTLNKFACCEENCTMHVNGIVYDTEVTHGHEKRKWTGIASGRNEND